MSAEVVSELLKVSILGPIVVLMGYALIRLYRRADELQELRVKDAKEYAVQVESLQKQRIEDTKAYAAQVLKLSESTVSALTSTNATMEAMREGMIEWKDTMKEWLRRTGGSRGSHD